MTDEPKSDPDAPVPLTFEKILEAIQMAWLDERN